MIARDEAAAIADRLREPWTSHRGEMAHVLRVDADRFRDLALTVVALHDEVSDLTTRLRLAEASVTMLRADLATRDAMLASERDLNDKLETEIRRLRAAEAPGTDDGAVAPWVWRSCPGQGYFWEHPTGPRVARIWTGWSRSNAAGDGPSHLALDAMRAAVPGSV